MIVHDLDVLGTIAPPKADAPLVVDPDAVLTDAVAAQRFKPITRWNAQIVQSRHSIEKQQLPSGSAFNGAKSANILIAE
jgi:hypothetical protein